MYVQFRNLKKLISMLYCLRKWGKKTYTKGIQLLLKFIQRIQVKLRLINEWQLFDIASLTQFKKVIFCQSFWKKSFHIRDWHDWRRTRISKKNHDNFSFIQLQLQKFKKKNRNSSSNYFRLVSVQVSLILSNSGSYRPTDVQNLIFNL